MIFCKTNAFPAALLGCRLMFALMLSGGTAAPAIAQSEVYDSLMSRFHDLDIAYFQDSNAPWAEHPFYLALQARISGDTPAYVKHLKVCLEQAKAPDVAQEYAYKLYFTYAYQGHRDEAYALKERYKLSIAEKVPMDLKAQDYPTPRAIMEPDTVSVPFDQFYFDAVVNGKDTVRVFFDTGAPGVSVSQDLVKKYGWPTDTTYSGVSALPAFGIQLKTYPTMIPELKIGELRLNNLFAKYGTLTEEEQARMKSSGIEQHDILLGLNALDGLVDGVAFDFQDSSLHFFKSLPASDAKANFYFAEGKPAIRYQLGGKSYKAFLDTGSPRHVVPKSFIEANQAVFNREAKYGSFTYKIYDLTYDRLLNLEDVVLETADYGFSWSKQFGINTLFGSFLGRELYFDLRNRVVELR